MKSYYQQKKGGWTLEPVIYAKTVKQIRCYRFFRRILDGDGCETASVEGGGAALPEGGGAALPEGCGAADREADKRCVGAADKHHAEATNKQYAEAADLATAKRYVEAVDLSLKRYVPEVYRKAVFAHMVDGTEYTDLEETSFASASTLKRYAQVFVWGVAEELGEIFPKRAGRNDLKASGDNYE